MHVIKLDELRMCDSLAYLQLSELGPVGDGQTLISILSNLVVVCLG